MFNTNDLRKKLHVLWNRHCLTVFALVAVVGTSYAAMNHADALYILTGVEDSAIVLDDETDTADLSSQLVFLSSNSTGYDVTLTAGQRAQITYNGHGPHHRDPEGNRLRSAQASGDPAQPPGDGCGELLRGWRGADSGLGADLL